MILSAAQAATSTSLTVYKSKNQLRKILNTFLYLACTLPSLCLPTQQSGLHLPKEPKKWQQEEMKAHPYNGDVDLEHISIL